MMNIEFRRVLFMTFALSGLLVGLAPAYVGSAVAETDEARTACMHDAFRLCDDTIPNVERTKACLAKHRSSLSPLCRSAMPAGGKHPRHRRHRRA